MKTNNKNQNRNNFRKEQNNKKYEPKREKRDENEYDDIIEGRNAVIELLNSDRDINKIIALTDYFITQDFYDSEITPIQNPLEAMDRSRISSYIRNKCN